MTLAFIKSSVLRGARGAAQIGIQAIAGVPGAPTTVQGALEGFKTLVDGKVSEDQGLPPGGTTGQALTKSSPSDYDADWSTVSGGGGGALNIELGDSPVVSGASVVDFDASAFTAASGPATEANVGLNFGSGAGNPAAGNHSHAHTALTAIDTDSATTAIHHTLGTGANQAAAGNDSRITGAAPATRAVNTTAPLTGGGDLSADRTLNINAATTSAAGSMSAADKSKLNNISVSVFKPTAYVAETVARANFATATSGLTSGTLHLDATYLVAGMVISTITFAASAAFANTSGTPNQWFSLWDGSRNFLRVTNDDGATAWGASTTKMLTLTSSYTVPADGLYYVGILVVATTPPTLRGMGMDNVIGALTPRLAGTSNTALTNPASAPATANTPIPNSFWAWAGLG